MAIYVVKQGQNIFDIAMHIYGSIEGIADLLISNPKLSMASTLTPGDELRYHDSYVINKSIVQEFNKQNIIPANDERYIYPKQLMKIIWLMIDVPIIDDVSAISISGTGEITIDWGDNSDLQCVQLSDTLINIQHSYNNEVTKRHVKVYGYEQVYDGRLHCSVLDVSNINGQIYTIHPVPVDQYIDHNNRTSLAHIRLFTAALSNIDLSYGTHKDLTDIESFNLTKLDLRNTQFSTPAAFDNYLAHWQTFVPSRACEVYSTTEPSEESIDIINNLVNNYHWLFNINGVIYSE